MHSAVASVDGHLDVRVSAGAAAAEPDGAEAYVALLAQHGPDGTGAVGERLEPGVAYVVGGVLQPGLGGLERWHRLGGRAGFLAVASPGGYPGGDRCPAVFAFLELGLGLAGQLRQRRDKGRRPLLEVIGESARAAGFRGPRGPRGPRRRRWTCVDPEDRRSSHNGGW